VVPAGILIVGVGVLLGPTVGVALPVAVGEGVWVIVIVGFTVGVQITAESEASLPQFSIPVALFEVVCFLAVLVFILAVTKVKIVIAIKVMIDKSVVISAF
jgi:hypothetical protein